jgi:hypothetical protein
MRICEKYCNGVDHTPWTSLRRLTKINSCTARYYVQIVRVAPLPADLHRWRGLRLAVPQHINPVTAAVRTFDAAPLGSRITLGASRPLPQSRSPISMRA